MRCQRLFIIRTEFVLVLALALAVNGQRLAAQANTQGIAKPASADQAFIDMMVPHHQQGIAMAQQAVAKATHPEIRQLAQKMINEQGRDVAEMKGWRRAWFRSDSTPPAMMTMDVPAGPDFDRMWLTEIFTHHGMAISSSEITLHSNARATVQEKARMMSDSQLADQHRIAAWLMAWYNQPAPTAGRSRMSKDAP